MSALLLDATNARAGLADPVAGVWYSCTMGTTEELEYFLAAAATRWSTMRGVVRHHRRHDLVTIGFEKYFAALDAQGWRIGAGPEQAVAQAVADPREIEAVYAVAAVQPGRRRVEVISRRGEEWRADLVVVDGPTWWARTPDGVITNDGDPQYVTGGTEELDLLTPGEVAAGHDLVPTADHETVAGRDCTVVTAVPGRQRVGRHVRGSEVFAMITGGDRFRLSVDDERGVLLRVVKEVDGADAETVEFVEIEFDVPLADDLFAPIAGTPSS